MHEHSLLGSCGAFLRAVASHWSGDGRLHDDAAQARTKRRSMSGSFFASWHAGTRRSPQERGMIWRPSWRRPMRSWQTIDRCEFSTL